MITVALEGIDGSGKVTQALRLAERLRSMGYFVHVRSFPQYDLPTGKWISDALTGKVTLPREALHLLFEVDRYSFEEWLRNIQALNLYDVVILDRWTMSNIVFAAAKGLSPEWIMNAQRGLLVPDMTFVLDIPAEESFRRRAERRDNHETNKTLLQKAALYYRQYADKLNERDDWHVVIVDGTQAPPEVEQEILSNLVLSGLIAAPNAVSEEELLNGQLLQGESQERLC